MRIEIFTYMARCFQNVLWVAPYMPECGSIKEENRVPRSAEWNVDTYFFAACSFFSALFAFLRCLQKPVNAFEMWNGTQFIQTAHTTSLLWKPKHRRRRHLWGFTTIMCTQSEHIHVWIYGVNYYRRLEIFERKQICEVYGYMKVKCDISLKRWNQTYQYIPSGQRQSTSFEPRNLICRKAL